MSPSPQNVELTRTVRFCINPVVPLPGDGSRHNTFAAWPGMVGLGAYYELDVRCQGVADPETGYLMNISVIDDAVRRLVLPLIHQAAAEDSSAEPVLVLEQAMSALREAFGGALASVRWRLTPYYSIAMSALATDRVIITQQFEFAAAHRLHCDSLSPEQNRAIFGRCNNPNSHGHNYRLEVAVEAALTDRGSALPLTELERIVDQCVIQRFDHTNLNVDVREFASVNPSVENIAKVCYELISPTVAEAGARLIHVTVWETEKTSCTYRGRDA